MWISKGHYTLMNQLIESSQERNTEMLRRESTVLARLAASDKENERMRADLDWFKHRLNQVEKERQMLIMDRIGVKIPVPEFVPVVSMPEEITSVNEVPDLSMIGEDAPAGFDPEAMLGPQTPDYSGMPARKNN